MQETYKLIQVRYGENKKNRAIVQIKKIGEFISWADASNYINHNSVGDKFSEFYLVDKNGVTEEVF